MPTKFGRMAELRKALGMDLEQLAAASGVPLSTLRKISSGATTNPNLETMKAIARALGCTLDDLTDATPAQMEAEKAEILNLYDCLDEAGRAALASYAKFLAAQRNNEEG